MNKSKISVLIYIIGLIFGALVLDVCSAFIGIAWTVILLIALFYSENYKNK